jgi:hypothetical protein
MDFADFVWHKGKVWFNPRNPVTERGEMSLWSVKNDGMGIVAKIPEVRDCTAQEIEAIKYFQGAKRSPELTRLSQTLEKHIDHWRPSKNDSHNIGNAVLASLRSVKDAVDQANSY